MSDGVLLNEATIQAIAETVADVLEERGLATRRPPAVARILTAVQVAEMLGVERNWVYEHAGELGGFRLGEGQTAQWRFDERRLTDWQRRQTTQPPPADRDQRTTSRRRRRTAAAGLIRYDEDTHS